MPAKRPPAESPAAEPQQRPTRYPLGFDVKGDPVTLPEAAAAWRVKRIPRSSTGGAPSVVYDQLHGTPLQLPLDADAEQLRERAGGGGRYRLEAIDGDGAYVGVTAVVELGGGGGAGEVVALNGEQIATVMVRTVAELATMVRAQGESLARVAEALSSGYGKVKPAKEAQAPVNSTATSADDDDKLSGAGEVAVAIMEGVQPLLNEIAPAARTYFEAKRGKSAADDAMAAQERQQKIREKDLELAERERRVREGGGNGVAHS